MVYTVVVWATRKAGLSPSEFRKHYEEVHMPLTKSLAGPLFPLSHTVFYLDRNNPVDKSSTDTTNTNFPAKVLLGTQEDSPYDSFAHIVFSDVSAFETFFAHMQKPEVASRMAEDEALFLERPLLTAAMFDSGNCNSN